VKSNLDHHDINEDIVIDKRDRLHLTLPVQETPVFVAGASAMMSQYDNLVQPESLPLLNNDQIDNKANTEENLLFEMEARINNFFDSEDVYVMGV